MNRRMLFAMLWWTGLTWGADTEILLYPDECWWGAVIDDGKLMPFTRITSYNHDLLGANKGNQIQPLLLSNHGRWVWSEEPFRFHFTDGRLIITADSLVQTGRAGSSLREAYRFASRNFFPPSGTIPEELLFTKPQFNTWIELTYEQNQPDILRYAKAIVDNGFSPGVLMIDDTWQADYGEWTFRADRFPDPPAMVAEIHNLGFKVMLWVCPFVSADSPAFRELRAQGLLLKNRSNQQPAVIEWWNGYSALLDFTNPQAQYWFKVQLERLRTIYQIDGFKFDAGDPTFYCGDIVSFAPAHANRHSELWVLLGLDYPLNEYRACWKMGGQPLAQRLRDKNHSWDDLAQLIPNTLVQGLMGYTYSCPDMIGGGEYQSFLHLHEIDQELVIRSAQCHTLMPMMQFSVAPWRILSPENLQICKKAADLHVRFGEHILQLARLSAQTNEQIVRSLEYAFPRLGYENIKDQFLLGDDILVAPVVVKGARERMVQFPPGVWRDEEGRTYRGPRQTTVPAPLDKLPWFIKVKNK